MQTAPFRILLLGDIHFGESYLTGGAKILQERGYADSLGHLRPFADAADTVIANLETPLVDPSDHDSPMKDERPFIHWGEPVSTINSLKELGVSAVNLANNHILDRGGSGFEATLKSLESHGLAYFGAGRQIDEADQPFIIAVPEALGGGEITLQGSFAYSRQKAKYGFYATDEAGGCAPLDDDRLAELPLPANRPDQFKIAFPHWGPNYNWANERQRRLAQGLLRRGYDLVIGHGAHCVQEVERTLRRWVVFGLGNGLFQAGGRYRKFEDENGILPYSFWAMLEIEPPSAKKRRVSLKLYPVYSDNRATDYRPHPLRELDFYRLVGELGSRASRRIKFVNDARRLGQDELGFFISLELGVWPTARPPRRLESIRNSKTSRGPQPEQSNIYDDPTSRRVLREMNEKRRAVGPLVIANAAKRGGASVHWLGGLDAVATQDGHSVAISRHSSDESAVSTAIVADKFLTKRLLSNVGVAVPEGGLASSPEEAVKLQRELGGPVVVKPRTGNMGRGVTVNITAEDQVREAFSRARRISQDVLVEEYLEGDEYRCHATSQECVGIFRRILPNVVGDGVSTIVDLIAQKNDERQLNPATYNKPIVLDKAALRVLNEGGFTALDIPREEVTVTVGNVNGITSGGDAEECLDGADEALRMAAVQAVGAIPGTDWGGVDIIVSRRTSRAYVMEVNTNAAITGSIFPTRGRSRDLASIVWRRLQAAHTAHEPVSLDTAPEPNGGTLGGDPDVVFGDAESARLDVLFQRYLSAQGFSVEHAGHNLLRVEIAENETAWFSRLMGMRDSSRSVRWLNRYGLQRQLLEVAGVPVVDGRRVREIQEIAEHPSQRLARFRLTPLAKRWDRSDFGVVTRRPEDGPWFVQEEAEGVQLRAFATSSQAVTLLGDDTSIASDTLQLVSKVAVDAVRAIPGLRWAVVDVRLASSARFADTPVLVEGMAMNPRLRSSDPILGGRLGDFFQQILR